jgi:hypothetical protein
MHNSGNLLARRGYRWAACCALTALLSVVIGVWSARAVAAEPEAVAKCDKPENFGADARVRVSQQRGRVLIEVVKPNTAGRKLEVDYGEELYSQKFSTDGSVRLGFALTAPENQFTLTMSETAPVTCTISVPGFNKIFRAVLRWHDPVQLDLNILEPNGRMGEVGHINGSRPNVARTDGIGQMDIMGGVPAADATGEMSYVADMASIPTDGVFGFKVDYITRGSQAEAPYCDDSPLATPRIDFIKIEGGKVTVSRLSLNRIRCHDKIPENRRLMPIR